MATQVQFRRGTTVDISTFIGADGEVVVDTTKKTCVVNDGVQIAGYPLLREDGSNSALSVGSLSSCALKFVNDPNTGIISPGTDQIALVTGGASRLSVDSSGSVTIPGNLLVAGSVTGSITFDNGSAAVPALRFTNDPDTGIYLAGTNELAISTGGTQRLTTTTTAVTSTLPVIHPLGAAATPSLTFTGDTNTGIYSPGADQVAISTNGTQRLTTDTAAVTSTLPVVHPLGAAATPSLTFAGDLNTGIYSPGADQVAVATNGTGRLFVDANGTVRVNSAIQATSNGGLNVEATSNGSSSAPFTLLNRGTSNDTGVFLTYRGLSSASAETDYAYMQMLATDTSSRHGAIAFWTANSGSVTERLRITSAGNVGIGTSSPNRTLHVYGDQAFSNSNNTGTLLFAPAASANYIYSRAADNSITAVPLGIAMGSTDAVRIDTSGRVGIGTTSPSSQLHCTGDIKFGDAITLSRNPATGLVTITDATAEPYTQGFAFRTNETDEAYRFQNGDGTSTYFTIRGSGNVGIGSSSPVATNHIRGSGTSGQVTASWILENASSGAVGMDVTGAAGSSIWRFLYTGSGPQTGTNTFNTALSIGVEGAAAGFVGIGTSSVSDKLEIANGTTDAANALGIRSGRYLNASQEGAQLKYYSDNTSSWLGTREVARISACGLNSDHRIGSLAFALKTTNSASDPTEMMRLTPTGLGIGTTSPAELLHVFGQSPRIQLTDSDTGADHLINANSSVGSLAIQCDTNAEGSSPSLQFSVGGNERVRIDSSGRLLVGTSNARTNIFNTVAAKLFQVESDGGTAGASLIRSSADGGSPDLVFGKSRSASVGGNTIVQSGDAVGSISFQGNDGSEFVAAASITAEVDGTPGANDMPGRLVFSTTADGASSPTERMRITSGGNIGIGTTSPASKLSVSDSSSVQIQATTGTVDFRIQSIDANSAAYSGTVSNHNYVFTTNNSERARIDTSGRLLVGTSTALTATDVAKSKLVLQGDTDGPGYPARFSLNNSVATMLANYKLGEIYFAGQAAGNIGASIAAYAESDWNTAGDPTDNPGYLTFSTTADGAGSPTERMRITSGGEIFFNTTVSGGEGGISLVDGTAGARQLFWKRASTASTSYPLSFNDGSTNVGFVSFTNTATVLRHTPPTTASRKTSP
jgi:hypothetical protein